MAVLWETFMECEICGNKSERTVMVFIKGFDQRKLCSPFVPLTGAARLKCSFWCAAVLSTYTAVMNLQATEFWIFHPKIGTFLSRL